MIVYPKTGNLNDCKATLAEVKAKGDKGADIVMARMIANHGNYTKCAKAYARQYAESGQ